MVFFLLLTAAALAVAETPEVLLFWRVEVIEHLRSDESVESVESTSTG